MLQKLTIKNYAIIDNLEISFPSGMNIITGETGAGKSIILGALGLVLGQRADSTALTDKEKKCVVEALFIAKGKKETKQFLQQNDFDITDEIVVRREIAVNGKSRAFINDTPVNLSQLNELSSMLVDLHQQFDTLELGRSDFQMEVIDALAGHNDLLDNYAGIFQNWQLVNKECLSLKEQKQQFEKELDYHQFQYNELEEAGLQENELEELDTELKMLANAEGIKEVLGKVYYQLEEGESPMVQQLKILANLINQYAGYHNNLPGIAERLQSVQIELKDIAEETDRIGGQINFSAERMEQINDKLSLGYKLLKKHGVTTTAELLKIKSDLEEKLQAVLNIDEAIGKKEKEAKKLFEEAQTLAKEITTGRKKQIKPFEEKVNKLLVQVGMPNAKLKVHVTEKDLGVSGKDGIEFLFDANKSGQYQPVGKVASGGELSRLMLCIKSLVAASINLPTMIFDEIDTGISGEAARQVGIIMKELAAKRQVICITHQPQIAGKADAHYFVYKEIVKDTVKTNIRQLTTKERITTIAQMLSGEKPTAAAMENAREMVGN